MIRAKFKRTNGTKEDRISNSHSNHGSIYEDLMISNYTKIIRAFAYIKRYIYVKLKKMKKIERLDLDEVTSAEYELIKW